MLKPEVNIRQKYFNRDKKGHSILIVFTVLKYFRSAN